MLTREELLFLKRAEGLESLFDKIRQAKALIAEAQVEMTKFMRLPVCMPHKSKKKNKSKKPTLSFGVDMPTELSADEQKVLGALKELGPSHRTALRAHTKLSEYSVRRTLDALIVRKLIKASGTAFGKKWETR